MVAYSFNKRFVDHVQAGLEPGPWCPGMKRHTLRTPRAGKAGHARPEQAVQLYTAMRTRHCRLIGRAVCRVQIPVTLWWRSECLTMFREIGAAPRSAVADLAPIVQQLLAAPPLRILTPAEMDEFARTDGFVDAAGMTAWFDPPKGEGDHVMNLVLVGWSPGEPAPITPGHR